MRLLPTVLIIIWVSLLQATNAESIKQAVPEEGHPDVDNPDTAATTTTTTTTGDTVTTDTPPESIAEEEKEESREQEVASHDTSNTGIRVPDTNTHPSRPKDVGANPKEERPQTVDPDNPASQHHTGGKQRLWGAPTTPHEDDIPKEEQTGKEEHHHNLHIHPPPRDDGSHVQEEHEPANQHQHHNVHIPFVPKSAHPPPPGYLISARVYIDPEDKLGHIDEDPLTLPYWDCGAVGSTTSPLKVADVAFRHSLTPSQGWTGTDGKHPVLAIALSEFILEVSSGGTKVIQPGEAVLLEDVLIAGHKMRPVSNHHPVRVMFLTLPKTHYSTGKDKMSISPTIDRNRNDPCLIPDETGSSTALQRAERDARIFRVSLGIAGLSLSTIVADFLGKTAPLWLAVGVGGLFFVLTGTVGTVVLGEAAANSFQAWRVQRRLKTDILSTTTDEDIAR